MEKKVEDRCPPPMAAVKFKVEGTAKGSMSLAGIGGVL